MKVKSYEIISFPDQDPVENFEFYSNTSNGTFKFHFKWINDAWSCWVTLPDNSVRQAGVYPNVVNWTGFSDYGLVFSTPLASIDFSSLFLTELDLIKWV